MALRVLIVTGTDKNELDVEQSGHGNDFCKSDEPYDIQFVLAGDILSGAEFCPIDGTPPGFDWVDLPPPLVFPMRKLVGKRRLKLLDVHPSKLSEGMWRYQLSVTKGKRLFQTTFDATPLVIPEDPCVGTRDGDDDLLYTRAINNPIIINR
jgi:hypothetical protein